MDTVNALCASLQAAPVIADADRDSAFMEFFRLYKIVRDSRERELLSSFFGVIHYGAQATRLAERPCSLYGR